MTSIADQSLDDLGGRWSILERQRRDHTALDRMLEELPRTTGADRQALVRRMCRLVFAHAFAEEAVLWPALRRSSPDGEELTARVEQEHQEITELVAQLNAADRWHGGQDELLDRVLALLRQDVSRALGAVAARVETLAPLRRGERSQTRTAPSGRSS